MPVAWLLLKPSRGRPNAPLIPLPVPLAADSSLPDYVVRADIYDKGMQRIWSCHDRFRMFFGGKSGHKGGEDLHKLWQLPDHRGSVAFNYLLGRRMPERAPEFTSPTVWHCIWPSIAAKSQKSM